MHDTEGPDDMPAHVKAMLTGVSLHVPVVRGELALGTWQGLYLIEHRARPHRREVVLQFVGSRMEAAARSERRSNPAEAIEGCRAAALDCSPSARNDEEDRRIQGSAAARQRVRNAAAVAAIYWNSRKPPKPTTIRPALTSFVVRSERISVGQLHLVSGLLGSSCKSMPDHLPGMVSLLFHLGHDGAGAEQDPDDRDPQETGQGQQKGKRPQAEDRHRHDQWQHRRVRV